DIAGRQLRVFGGRTRPWWGGARIGAARLRAGILYWDDLVDVGRLNAAQVAYLKCLVGGDGDPQGVECIVPVVDRAAKVCDAAGDTAVRARLGSDNECDVFLTVDEGGRDQLAVIL